MFGIKKKQKPEQPNKLFFSFLPINALRLLKRQKIKKQEQHEQLKINKNFCRYVLSNPVRYILIVIVEVVAIVQKLCSAFVENNYFSFALQ